MKKLIAVFIIALFSASVMALSVSAAYSAGDINKDGSVNAKDMAMLRRHLLGAAVIEDLTLADLNADSAVNIKDLIAMKKITAGTLSGIELEGGAGQQTVIPDNWD